MHITIAYTIILKSVCALISTTKPGHFYASKFTYYAGLLVSTTQVIEQTFEMTLSDLYYYGNLFFHSI